MKFKIKIPDKILENQNQNPENLKMDMDINIKGDIKPNSIYNSIISILLGVFWNIALFISLIDSDIFLKKMNQNQIEDIIVVMIYMMLSILLIITFINWFLIKPRYFKIKPKFKNKDK